MAQGRWIPDQVRDDDDHDDVDGEAAVPAWVTHVLAGLMVTGSTRTALAEAGIEFDTAWALHEEEPEFAMYWERALRVHKGVMAGLAMLDAAECEEASVH
jgi:hypothetical protein